LLDAVTESEELRLCDWLHATEYADLVQRALDLGRWHRAA
jgi:hypothetical protein